MDAIVPAEVFDRYIRTGRLKSLIKSKEYVFTYLPGGLSTKAAVMNNSPDSNVVACPLPATEFSFGYSVVDENEGPCCREYWVTHKQMPQSEVTLLYEESTHVPIRKTSFSEYLESPIIYFRFPGSEMNTISPRNLIHRTANEYEASHATAEDTLWQGNDPYSFPVKRLMEYTCIGLPLPYFVLLHVAKQIIQNYEQALV